MLPTERWWEEDSRDKPTQIHYGQNKQRKREIHWGRRADGGRYRMDAGMLEGKTELEKEE